MNEDFNKFHKQMLISAKTEADGVNWVTVGLFVGILSIFYPATDCFLLTDYDAELDLKPAHDSICKAAESTRLAAMAWIGFSLLRIFFLASKWQADLALKFHDLRIERENGKTVDLKFAALYAFLEWLPFHILSLYVLIYGIPANLYALASLGTFAAAAQVIWLAPVIFKYRGQNIPEYLARANIVFTSEKEGKIEEIYQEKRSSLFKYISFFIRDFTYVIFTFFLIYVSVQIFRTPDIKPDYERLLYADRGPIWENNLHFAIEGLTAPSDVKNTYAYGRAKAQQKLKDFEALKKLANITYSYEVPAETGDLPPIRRDQELSFNDEGWKDLSCLFSINHIAADCATWQDFRSYIHDNQIIWDRFNALSDYPLYRSVPQIPHGKMIDFVSLERLKAAQIIHFAENGNAEEAFNEWEKYMKYYRSMAGAQETLVFKAIMAITVQDHLNTFTKLLYLHPNLARSHSAEINEALKPAGTALFREDRMPFDDAGLVEPILLASIGNVNAIRNDFYVCLTNFEQLAKLPPNEFPFNNKNLLCPFQQRSKEFLMYPFTQPGYFISNITGNLFYGGMVKSPQLAAKIKLIDVQMRMAMLAAQVLEQDILVEDIPAFIALSPAQMKNSITQKPFEWDAQTKSIFFVSPGTGTRFKFPLNK